MGFQAVTFPDLKMLHNIQRSESAPVKVVGNFTKQYRIKKHRWPRYDWTIPSHSLKVEDANILRDFLISVDYTLDSFRFVDPYVTAFPSSGALHILTHSTGEYWLLNTPEGKPIFNPIMSELSFYHNSSGRTPTFSIDATGNPVVYFSGSSFGDTVIVIGNIYMTARFDTTFATSIVAMDSNNAPIGLAIGEMKITEVFEY